ncbi:hypothetical protein PTE30175_02675 [Pandoraea terrae]|uniref:DUF2917 domain-containing protein n=1 Tax=Pandoraea terrae TaxID=1537710 RepID=A0A5E4VQX0_9BURK|nr:DUF2917 domain-containing protein [Pandoraea terrae]VVE13440.1 hypothetical protein PTE30175_02675 [Pandoraea terrae]
MREIRMFELDGRQAVKWQTAAPQSLQVLQGLLWLTVEGESGDHWLRAGDTFETVPGQTMWLGTWNEGARFRLSQPTAPHKRTPRPTFDWRMLLGRFAMRRQTARG